MNHRELEALVLRAIDNLYAFDSQLIVQGASEWSLSHRLAVYLEQLIPGWNVDCEYNRQEEGKDPKRAMGKGKRPDIVLHHRGRHELSHNLLAVEIKKASSEDDKGKVAEYTRTATGSRTYQYQYGLALVLGTEPSLSWYQNGNKIS